MPAQNPHTPLPINPLGPGYAVGGSSGGSAIAVATGLCYAALGSDTAGSVRVPAATCGVFGLKPTNGVLEATGCFPLAPSLDTVGILSRSALDAALLLAICANPKQQKQLLPNVNPGKEAIDPSCLPQQNLRIATAHKHPTEYFSAKQCTANAMHSVATQFAYGSVKQHGIMQLPEQLTKFAEITLRVEAAATHYHRLKAENNGFSGAVRSLVLPGLAIPSVWYARALQAQQQLRQEFINRYLKDSDILLTPVLPHGIPQWDQVHTESSSFEPKALLAMLSWVSFVNYLGLPAVVFPVGTDSRGAPISVQAIARPYAEGSLLSFAYQVERELFGNEGFVAHPTLLRGRSQ